MFYFDFELDANKAKADGNNADADEAIEADADKTNEADKANEANEAKEANKAKADKADDADKADEADSNEAIDANEAKTNKADSWLECAREVMSMLPGAHSIHKGF